MFTFVCCLVCIVVVSSFLYAYQGISLTIQRESFAQKIESHTVVIKQVMLSRQIFTQGLSQQDWLSYHNQLSMILADAPELSPTQQVIINSIESRNKNLKVLFESQNSNNLVDVNKVVQSHLYARLLAQLESIRSDAVQLSEISRQQIYLTLRQQFLLVSIVLLGSMAVVVIGSIQLRFVFNTSLLEVKKALKANRVDKFHEIHLSYPTKEFDDIVAHYHDMNAQLKENSVSIEVMQQVIAERTQVLEELTRTDPLTQIPNRRALFERGKLEHARNKRMQHGLTVILFDCDHFKRVNDEYGHCCGDQVLKHVAHISRREIRDVDFIGRYGGEEFVIILPDCNMDGGVETAARIQQKLDQMPLHYEGKTVPVTLSAGICVLSNHNNFESMLKDADQAMYLAKQRGRNRIEVAQQSTMH